jgi:restriction system protein
VRDVNEEYKDHVAYTAQYIAYRAFRANAGLLVIHLSLMMDMLDRFKGTWHSGCVLSVQIDRDTFNEIRHEMVEPDDALRNFPLRFSYDRTFAVREVQPFPGPQSDSILQQVDLATIAPRDFELLVQSLLQRMGYQAQVTKSSGDGGIDVVAVNTEPIVGGTILVQCKRYSGVVGSPMIRDLYGAMNHEGASKGVLITTSRFSLEAIKFAEGKPLELIDGQQLEELLRRYQVAS